MSLANPAGDGSGDSSGETPRLAVAGLSKRFGGVVALDGVSLAFAPASVHAVIGENGAGKSTLMKILAGVESADQGEVLVDGKAVSVRKVQDALDLGIALIHQELNLADNLDVAANLFLGREPTRWGMIDRKRIEDEARRYLEMVGLDLDPSTPLSRLTIGTQQLVEIAKALSVGARVLIMDEPTSSLTLHETETLYGVIDSLRDSGVTVIYISHRLTEVIRLADRVSVLRDGQNAGELSREEMDHDTMVRAMVGRDIDQFYAKRDVNIRDEVRLKVTGLRTAAWPSQTLSFQVRAGETVGIAGLVGAGRTEALRAIFGADAPIEGEVQLDGQLVSIGRPIDAIQLGMALVPEDRKSEGVVLSMTIRDNIALPNLPRHQSLGGFVRGGEIAEESGEMMTELRIKAPHDRVEVGNLSGGNQQKVALAKWLAANPIVLMLDEPTRGVDIGAKQEIYGLIERLASQGVAILFASSDMEEVLSLSDRVLVMHEGKLTGEFSCRDCSAGLATASEQNVMLAAVGGDPTSSDPPCSVSPSTH